MRPLETPHLLLRLSSAADLLALIEGVDRFEQRTGLRTAAGLRDFFVSGDLSPVWLERLRAMAAAAPDPWANGFGVIDRESNAVVGTAGFKGPPDNDGVVEIAYGIVPSHEGRGYATEAASALVAFAFDHDAVRVVCAHTLPTPNASTRVLTKCGFGFKGPVEDPEDGLVWRWELTRDSAERT